MPFDLQIGRLDSTLSTSSGHMWLLDWPPGLDIELPWPRTTYLVCEKFKLRHKTDDDTAFFFFLFFFVGAHLAPAPKRCVLTVCGGLCFMLCVRIFSFLFFTFWWLIRLMGKWSTRPTSTARGIIYWNEHRLVFKRKNVWDYWNSFNFLSVWISEKHFAWCLLSFIE